MWYAIVGALVMNLAANAVITACLFPKIYEDYEGLEVVTVVFAGLLAAMPILLGCLIFEDNADA